MSRRSFPWSLLGIDPTSDRAAIRKAYADALRAIDPDADIAGFAELRRARDQALWLAARQADENEDADADDGAAFGLGTLEDDAAGLDWDEDDGGWDIAPAFTPGDRPASPPELGEAQRRAQEAWERLLGVLYPAGNHSGDAVTHAELDEGLAALAVLTARAEEADLQEHDALASALADLLARIWPRSAPFVEPANAAFHWLDEAGALEERHALRFLNDRLKGMRFHEKVQRPDHPLHKAWVELSRPGRAGVLDRLRVNRLDVHKLLAGLRERYPELESHLDPERVASWDTNAGISSDDTGPGVVRWIIILIFVGSALARLGGNLASDHSDGSAPSEEEVSRALIDAQLEIASPEVFGPGTDLALVRAADPLFADQWRLATGQGGNTDAARAFVRLRAAASGKIAAYDHLVIRAVLRAMWMRAALPQSPQVCRNIMAGDFSSTPLALDAKQRVREQELLRRLLDAKVLSHVPKGGETRFAIPGWAIDKMMKRSGLGIDELTAALKDPDHPKRCLVDLAMAEVVLEEPGRFSAETLRAP